MTDYCRKCHSPMWDWQPPHECTEFFVTDGDEESVSFWVEDPALLLRKSRRTPDFEDAAEAWARNYNEDGDYALMNETIDISIMRNGEFKRFRVGAEPDISYSVDELEDPPEDM